MTVVVSTFAWLLVCAGAAMPSQAAAPAHPAPPIRASPFVEYVERGPAPVRIVEVRIPESGLLTDTEFLVENVSAITVDSLVFQTSWPDLTEGELGRVAPLGFVEGRPEFSGLAAGPEPLHSGEKRYVKLAPGVAEALDLDFAQQNIANTWACELRLVLVEGDDYKWIPNADLQSSNVSRGTSCPPSTRIVVPITTVPSKRAASER